MSWRDWLRRRRRADEDLTEELQAHIELQTRKHIAAGVGSEEARRRARVEFGSVEPGTLLRLERGVGPGLMGVPRQQHPLRDPESRVVRGERLRQRCPRMFHRSGNSGVPTVVAR